MTSDDTQVEAKLPSEDKCSFGKQLKTARENMGLSAQEAAIRLHLSPRFIHLLENEDLQQSTLPPIYLRGYLRSYSRLLNIPEQDVAAILEQLAPTPAILTSPTASSESLALSFPLETNPYYARIATFFVSLVLLTSVTTWWYLHTNTSSPTLVASSQTLAPEQNLNDEQVANNPTPTDLKNLAAVVAAASPTPNTNTAPTPSPSTATVATNQQLALAPTVAERTPNSLIPSPAKPVSKHLAQEESEDNADESE